MNAIINPAPIPYDIFEVLKEQEAQIEKEIVYVDKIIEKDKPIHIRECISDDAVEFLNSKGVVK